MKNSDCRVLVTGAGGLLGKYLVNVLDEAGIVFFGLDRLALDITDLKSLQSKIIPLELTHIINCAAYTNVKKAEVDRDLCYKVNVLGVQNLVQVANQMSIDLIQISTDYVFDGIAKDGIYYPDSKKKPLNYYGLTKSIAEDFIIANASAWKIIRTSWLFGLSSNNFVSKIIKFSQNNKPISINDIEIGIPTYGLDLAYTIINHLNLRNGIYHFTNSGTATRFQYTEHILKLTTGGIVVVNNKLSSDVKRPTKAILFNSSNLELRHWTLALSEYLSEWKSIHL